MTSRSLVLPLLFAACLGLVACDGGSDDGHGDHAGHEHAADAVALPDGVFVETAPDGAQDLGEVKASAKEGDVVVVAGKVGGTMEPFVKGRAVMTVAGLSGITSCDKRPGDNCPTPWDFCCDDPKSILANTATVELVDAEGRPLKVDLEGAHGLAPLSEVVVRGTVGPRPDPGVLVIHADAIHVKP